MGNRAEGQMGKRGALEKSLRVAGEVPGAVHIVTRSMTKGLSDVDVSCLETAAAIEKPKREEKGGSRSKSDRLLRTMFDKWAKKFNKKYSSEEERQKRFRIFCSSKKRLDRLNSCPSTLASFNHLADRSGSEVIPGGPMCYPPINNVDKLMERIWLIKADGEEQKEAKIEFAKWVNLFGKTYDTEEEERKRFLIFLDNKRRVDACKDPLGYRLGNMDKTWWEQAEEAAKMKMVAHDQLGTQGGEKNPME